MTPKGDPKSFTCDVNSINGIRWDQTSFFAPATRDTPRNVRPSATFFNRGQSAWPLIARSKPVPAGGCWASALPVGAMSSSGSTPLRLGFCVSAKNLYGVSVVSIGYEFILQSGSRLGASGMYIARLEVAPTNVDIAWGWNVDMTVAIQSPGEYGDPTALFATLPAQLQLKIETEIKTDQVSKLHLAYPQGVLMQSAGT